MSNQLIDLLISGTTDTVLMVGISAFFAFLINQFEKQGLADVL